MLLPSKTCGRGVTRVCATRPGGAAAPAPAPIAGRPKHIEAQPTLQEKKVIVRGTEFGVSDTALGQLALERSIAARTQRRTHLNTVNLAATQSPPQQQLPLSQLAFKALLRASLAAARLRHGCLTTPHLLLGLLSVHSPSLCQQPAAAAADAAAADATYAVAEAAVVAMIDGPAAAQQQQLSRSPLGAGAAACLLGTSGGLGVVQWVGELSDPARAALAAAEVLRTAAGDPLLTSHHLVAALLKEPAAAAAADASDGTGSSSSAARRSHQRMVQLLQQLGLDAAAAAAAASAAPEGDDAAACRPLGFLHEEFYASLCSALTPGDSRSAAPFAGSTCLN